MVQIKDKSIEKSHKTFREKTSFSFNYNVTQLQHISLANWILFNMNLTRVQASTVVKLFYKTQSPLKVVRIMQKEYLGLKQLDKQHIFRIVNIFEKKQDSYRTQAFQCRQSTVWCNTWGDKTYWKNSSEICEKSFKWCKQQPSESNF